MTTATLHAPSLTIEGTTYTMAVARIDSTTLGVDDHICLPMVNLGFAYADGGSQGLGGFVWGTGQYRDGDDASPYGGYYVTSYLARFVATVLHVTDAPSWESLLGVRCYVLRESKAWNALIDGIASIDKPDSKFVIFADIAVERGES